MIFKMILLFLVLNFLWKLSKRWNQYILLTAAFLLACSLMNPLVYIIQSWFQGELMRLKAINWKSNIKWVLVHSCMREWMSNCKYDIRLTFNITLFLIVIFCSVIFDNFTFLYNSVYCTYLCSWCYALPNALCSEHTFEFPYMHVSIQIYSFLSEVAA